MSEFSTTVKRCTTNIVTSVEITGDYAHDSPRLRSLVTATARHFRLGDVPADKAYSSKDNLGNFRK
jgi:hypothetical protein